MNYFISKIWVYLKNSQFCSNFYVADLMYKNFKASRIANKNYITWNSFDFLCRVVPYVAGRWDISDTLLLS